MRDESVIPHFGIRLHFEEFEGDGDNEVSARLLVHDCVSRILLDFGSGILLDREREVARLVLQGQSAKSIASFLGISPGTVNIHRSNIYHKLDVSGRNGLLSALFSQLVSAQ